MQALAHKFYSEEEYWALEETSPVKHEYWDGEIVAMAGGTFNHGRVAANVVRHVGKINCTANLAWLSVAMCASKCKKAKSDSILIPMRPSCVRRFNLKSGAAASKTRLLNPRVLVEVISPSTGEFDQNEKFDQYKLIESLTDYILIWPERVRVKHYHRTRRRLDRKKLTRSALTVFHCLN